MKKGHSKVTFKPYTMDQLSLLPASLEELIPEDHLVRVVNRVMDELDLEPILNEIQGRRDEQLSSADDAEGAGICIYPESVLVAADRQRAAGERELHVDQWGTTGRTFGRSIAFAAA